MPDWVNLSKSITVDLSLLRAKLAVEQQLAENWCWAAVAVSIARYYDGNSSWTQCTLANQQLGKKDCCTNKKPCDKKWDLDLALKGVKHFNSMTAKTVTYDLIVAQLRANRPVAIRINVKEKNGISFGHFAVIGSYWQQMITINDPMYGTSTLEFKNLKKDFPFKGSSWTHTYFTKPLP